MDRRTWLRWVAGGLAYPGGTAFAQSAAEPSLESFEPSAPNPSAPPAQRPTLDSNLQRAATKLLGAARPVSGAALLVDAQRGELLVFEAYRSRSGLPHPIFTPVPAASVFKLITTTALFERTPVNPRTRVCIAGGEHAIERAHLEPALGQGSLCAPFFSALGFSRNAAFAQLATAYLPRTALLETAERFGFNAPLPFDTRATVGSLELPYNDLEFARAAAGFQGSLLSPLGAAFISLAIARGGEPLRLRRFTAEPSIPEPLPRVMSKTTAARLTRMMEVTIHSGTSRSVFAGEDGKGYLGPISVAGKTGTLRPDGVDSTTSWFMGFAPSRSPEVAVAVMLQNGPVWRRKANEIARDLLRCYFAGRPLVSDPFSKTTLAAAPRER